jgi:glycosyltransferase involved in cell wall biosynthesis
MKRLAIITTHPIQYNAPFFKKLTKRKKIELKVFYTWSQSMEGVKFDPGFGKVIQWDLPLLEGYSHTFSENVSSSPGSHHYKGIDNPFLIQEIEKWQPDALLVYGWRFKSHLKAMRYFKGKIPLLFRGDSTLLDEKTGLKKYIRRVILKLIYSYVDIALYAGNANKEYFKVHGLKENELFFMPHAIDNMRFANSPNISKLGLGLREKLQIPKDALVFLFAGKLDENKNIALLLNAFNSAKNESSFLLITGNGSSEADLKATFSEIQNIRFLDFQNQQMMPALYASANVFVLPSISETWGLAINEAMAAGMAIIISNSCGASFDLVKDNKNGFVFETKNIESLKKCLQYFVENPNAANNMGEVSTEIIKYYSYENDCIAVETALEAVNCITK